MTFFNKFNTTPIEKPKMKETKAASLKDLRAQKEEEETAKKKAGRPKGSVKKKVDMKPKRKYSKKASDGNSRISTEAPLGAEVVKAVSVPAQESPQIDPTLPLLKRSFSDVSTTLDKPVSAKPYLFQPGNKAGKGRAEGSRTRAQITLEAISYESADALLKKMVAQGLEGDIVASKFVLERILPAAKGRRVKLDLPVVESIKDIGDAMTIIVDHMATGEITLEEAETATRVLEIKLKSFEQQGLEKRIEGIEDTLNIKRGL